MKHYPVILCLLCLFSTACDRGDADLRIVTKNVHLLQQQNGGERKELIYDPNSHSIRTSNSNCIDLHASGEKMVLAFKVAGGQPANNLTVTTVKERLRVSRMDATNRAFEADISGVAMGEDNVAFLDSLGKKIYFWQSNATNPNRDVLEVTLPHKPLAVSYASGNFYVAYDNQTVGVWSEQAKAERAVAPYRGKFVAFSQDFLNMHLFATSGDSVLQNRISTTSFTPLSVLNSAFSYVQFSDIEKSNFGTEWLSAVGLSKKGDLLPDITLKDTLDRGVTSFSCDFFGAKVYYTKGTGQLYIRDLWNRAQIDSLNFEGIILKSAAFQAYEK